MIGSEKMIQGGYPKMKRKWKALLFISALVGLPALYNAHVEKRFRLAFGKRERGKLYSWVYGDIRYMVRGKGKPLLLVHDIGGGAGLHEWDRAIAALSRQYTVYAIDLIGFGLSDKPAMSYSPYLFARCINDFARDVIGGKANIAASGLGAAFAAAAYKLAPELYSKVLLVSPEGVGMALDLADDKQKWVRRLLELPVFGTFIHNIMHRVPVMRYLMTGDFYRAQAIPDDFWQKSHESAYYGGASAKYPLAAYAAKELNLDTERLLRDVHIPVHIIWGGQNRDNPPENFESILANSPGINLTVLPHAGRYPHYEDDRAFCRECIRFFQ